jgi:hypothetical protein
MIHRIIRFIHLAPMVLLAGCQGVMPINARSSTDAMTLRDQGYALLYSVLSDESKVDKVLLVKNPNPQVAELLKAIARFADDGKSKLEAMSKEDPTFNLGNDGLPEMETRTRDAISSATSRQILFSGGAEFEFNILLAQHQALNYITHLAGTLSDEASRDDRKQYFSQLAEQANVLHARVMDQLKTPYVGQSK